MTRSRPTPDRPGSPSPIGRWSLAIGHSLLVFVSLILILIGCAHEAASRHGPQQSPGSLLVKHMTVAPLKVTIPRVGREVERQVLPNGLVLYVAEDRTLPLVEVYAVVRAGSLTEPSDRPGVAQLTASELRNGGTASLAGSVLDEELEGMGASLEVSASSEAITLHLSALAKDADRTLQLFVDVLRHPAFAPGPFQTSKGRLIEDLRRVVENPSRLLAREFARRLYTEDHPLGRPLTAANVASIQRDDLVAHHRRLFHPNNVLLAVAGDFRQDEMTAKLAALFGDWRAATLDLPAVPPVTPRFERGVYIIPRPLDQASLILGHVGIDRFNPDRYAIELMDRILGGSGFNSRVVERVRTEEGLAYSVATAFPTGSREPGLFRATLQTKNENVPRATTVILEEIRRIQEQPVTPLELARAKEALSNSFVFRFTSRFRTVLQLLMLEFDGYPPDYYENLLDRYRAVTAGDIQRVARQYLHPDATTILVVGDAARFEGAMAAFGPVHRLTPAF